MHKVAEEVEAEEVIKLSLKLFLNRNNTSFHLSL